jgi:hypothetical protein
MHDFGTFGSAVQNKISPVRVKKFDHSWDSFRKNFRRTLSPKVTSPKVSPNVRMPYGKRGNIKEEKKTHPKRISPPQPKDVDEGPLCSLASSFNMPSRKDCCCTFSTLAISSER